MNSKKNNLINWILLILYLVGMLISIFNFIENFKDINSINFLSSFLTSITSFFAFLLLFINKSTKLNRYFHLIISLLKKFDFTYKSDVYLIDPIENINLFSADIQMNLEKNDYKVLNNKVSTGNTIDLSIKSNKYGQYDFSIYYKEFLYIKFNRIILTRISVKKMAKYMTEIIDLISKSIPVSKVNYYAELVFSNNDNPYLKYFIQTNTESFTDVKLTINNEVKISSNILSISTSNKAKFQDTIDKTILKMI